MRLWWCAASWPGGRITHYAPSSAHAGATAVVRSKLGCSKKPGLLLYDHYMYAANSASVWLFCTSQYPLRNTELHRVVGNPLPHATVGLHEELVVSAIGACASAACAFARRVSHMRPCSLAPTREVRRRATLSTKQDNGRDACHDIPIQPVTAVTLINAS